MKKIFIGLVMICLVITNLSSGAAGVITTRIHLNPITAIVEQNVASSLVLTQTLGSSVVATYITSFKPQVWVTSTGSSVTSFAFSGPSMGTSLGGQTDQFGGSLTLPLSWVFHAPSMYPAYGNSLQVGTQTYSVSAQLQMSDGQILYPTAGVIKVGPRPLADSEVSGWH